MTKFCTSFKPVTFVACAATGRDPGDSVKRVGGEGIARPLGRASRRGRTPASLEAAGAPAPGRCEASDAPIKTAECLDARFEAPESQAPAPAPTEPQPPPPAGAHRSIWHTPWVMEGLAAASISLLVGVCIVLGYHVFDRMSLRGPRTASPDQHLVSPVPDASR